MNRGSTPIEKQRLFRLKRFNAAYTARPTSYPSARGSRRHCPITRSALAAGDALSLAGDYPDDFSVHRLFHYM